MFGRASRMNITIKWISRLERISLSWFAIRWTEGRLHYLFRFSSISVSVSVSRDFPFGDWDSIGLKAFKTLYLAAAAHGKTHVRTQTNIQIYTHIHKNTHPYTFTKAYMHTYIYMYTYTFIHKCIAWKHRYKNKHSNVHTKMNRNTATIRNEIKS